mgnify:CR=1 FL=1
MSDRGEAQAAPEAVPTSGLIGPEVMQSAGGQLRAARQAQGLHIVHLAAMLKVAPSRLEALEANRFDAMPDMVYARALLSSACRCMKIDPEPMLALLPQASVHPLQAQSDHLNQAFHEHLGGGRFFSGSWRSKPLNWLLLALVLAIVLVLLWPGQKPLESAQAQTNATQPQEPVAPKTVAPVPATDQPAVNPVGVGMGNAEIGRAHV